ncbi:cytochrome-c peroxidase [Sulfidibacter corallicola]|uniref:C-type cytochrome n=1 Tax=Sulfidibacter corallicola TaxID=2818388 RepID=A0A8A4TRL0_SULCO|nr:cytochrome c peroxidase [Sulfidibacter corallicola]QTD51814.1 c-type cytochrome [Sulfidibacter corallicola]
MNEPPAPLSPPPQPEENPVTPAKAYLGKALFWDEQLSSNGTVACGTCHLPSAGGCDPRLIGDVPKPFHPGADNLLGTEDDVVGSLGVSLHFDDGTYGTITHFGCEPQVTGRKTPPSIDVAYANSLFWDGRAGNRFFDPDTGRVLIRGNGALENQVMGPPVSDVEMGHVNREWGEVVTRIAAARPLALAEAVPAALHSWIGDRTYPELFSEAFGTAEVTSARIAMAIATYERILYSDQTPLDVALRGGTPLTAQEQLGLEVFVENNCHACHEGGPLTDNGFRFIGIRPPDEDVGRFGETGNPDHLGEFRTPSLRNVALRPPYFHTGRFETLEDVVDFYLRGGDFDAPNKPGFIRPRNNVTAEERAALIAFLKRPLIDPRVEAGSAPFDPVILYSQSDRVPQIEGIGLAGSGGFEPRPIALEPPIAGSDNFTVAIAQGLGGAAAVLVVDDQDPGVTAQIPAQAGFARREVTLQGTGEGQGYASVNLTIDPSASPSNGPYYGRWYVSDPAAPGGIAISKAFRFNTFRPANETWCGADIDMDLRTSVLDFATLVNETGDCPVPCAGDLNASGSVDQVDLLRAISSWAACD